jgi:hypothetical protein
MMFLLAHLTQNTSLKFDFLTAMEIMIIGINR